MCNTNCGELHCPRIAANTINNVAKTSIVDMHVTKLLMTAGDWHCLQLCLYVLLFA